MKIIKENEQLILQSSLINKLINSLVVLGIFLFVSFMIFKNMHSFDLLVLIFPAIYLILFLFVFFKKDLYQCIFDKDHKSITIIWRNFFFSHKKYFSFNDLIALQIDKRSDDDYNDYILYIVFSEQKIFVHSARQRSIVEDMANAIINFVDNPALKINPATIIYESHTSNTNNMPAFYKYYSKGREGKFAGSLFVKKVSLKRTDNKLILKIRKSFLSVLAFLLLLFFFFIFTKDILTIESITFNKINNNKITCSIKNYLLGNENMEISSLHLEHFKDVRLDVDDEGGSIFIILYDKNLEYSSINFDQKAFEQVKNFIEDKEETELILWESFSFFDLFWFLLLAFLIIAYMFIPYISCIIIDKDNFIIQIKYKGFRMNKHEKHSIHVINSISYNESGKQYYLEIELFGKKIELGVLTDKEKISEIIDFLNS